MGAVVRRFGLSVPTSTHALQWRCLGSEGALAGPAGRAIDQGESVFAVAQRYGLDYDPVAYAMHMRSIGSRQPGPAGLAIAQGEPVDAVVRRFGFFKASAISELHRRAIAHQGKPGPAGLAIDRGEPPAAVAQRFGFCSDYFIGLLHKRSAQRARWQSVMDAAAKSPAGAAAAGPSAS